MTTMFKTIKKIWEKVHFGVYPILKFAKRLYYIAFVMGLALAVAFYFYEDRSKNIEEKLDIGLNEKWTERAHVNYLNVNFSANEIPVIFTTEDVKKIVIPVLKAHNYKVEAREANKKNGFVVKEDIRYSDKVRFFYIEGRVFLISDNLLKEAELNEDFQTKLGQFEIPIS